MANAGVPDFLLGQTATVFAFLLLFASVFAIMTLAMFQMKPDRLMDAFRKARKSMRTTTVEQEPDVEMGLTKPRKKRSRKLGSFNRFFSRRGREYSAYELDDDIWLAPEAAPGENAAQKMEAYELSDDVWRAPFIAV